jgi:uncharacterized protein YukE
MTAPGRVTVDDVAHTASNTILNILNNQLPNAFTALKNAGTDLTNPQHWDGKSASDFRTNVWPQVQSDLTKMQTSLSDLQRAVDTILKNISTAGGN